MQNARTTATSLWHFEKACVPCKKPLAVVQQAALAQKNMVPIVGIELTTYRLQGGCSTN